MSYEGKENYVYNFDDKWNRSHNKYKIITRYKDILDGSVVELGSNSGYHCYLAAEFGNVEKVLGVDLNQDAINTGNGVVRKKFPKAVADKVSFMCANLMELPIEDESYDTIISFHTLEHIYPEDLNQVLIEKYRILKTGGNFIVSLPYKDAYPCPKHVNQFDEEKLTSLLEGVGFKKVEMYVDKVIENQPITYCLTALFTK